MTPRPLSPDEKAQYSQLLGRGVYSGLQLNQLLQSKADKVLDGDDDNILHIKLPREKLEGVKKASSSLGDNLASSTLNMVKGFNDKKHDYLKSHKDSLQEELNKAEEEYLSSLSINKRASLEKISTPHVDALCLGILKSIEKEASENVSDHSMTRAIKELAHPITKHFPDSQTLKDDYLYKPMLTSVIGTYLLRKKMTDKKDQPTHKPLSVEIEAV